MGIPHERRRDRAIEPTTRKFCGAKNRQGVPCRNPPAHGSIRCRFHGGGKAKFPPGDPRRGGVERRTGLYARHLPPEQLEAFDAAALGNLDQEIRLAKANLDWAVQRWTEDPLGGVVTTRGDKSITERLWVDIVREHGEHVRKLEAARAVILAGEPPPNENVEAYEIWRASAKTGSSPGRSRR